MAKHSFILEVETSDPSKESVKLALEGVLETWLENLRFVTKQKEGPFHVTIITKRELVKPPGNAEELSTALAIQEIIDAAPLPPPVAVGQYYELMDNGEVQFDIFIDSITFQGVKMVRNDGAIQRKSLGEVQQAIKSGLLILKPPQNAQ